MKSKLRILLTGDDGYDSPGTRILARVLKDDYDVNIVGTVEQQSGVGGHLSIRRGGSYGEATVEGVRAIYVDGYPCDGMEFAVGYFPEAFDIVVSGINWGMNVGGAILSSGTYVAANRALNLKLARYAIAMSWHVPPEKWLHRHNGEHDISEYLEYPGVQARKIVDLAVKQKFWGADLLNVNYPTDPSDTIRFTRHLADLRQFFNYPIDRDPVKKTFSYPKKELQTGTSENIDVDTGAMLSGYISITPHKTHMLDEAVYEKLKKQEIKL